MSEEQLEIKLARSSLIAYACLQYPQFIPASHLVKIATKLEAVERGEISRLMIFAPPRHGKSLLTSKLLPAWFMGRNPRKDIIFTSYSQDIADDCGRYVQQFMNSEIHKACFPTSNLAKDSQSVRRFHTTAGGAYYAAGVGGPITGRGGHLRMIDDPYKNRQEADSDNNNRILTEWYTSTFYTRGQVDFDRPTVSAEFSPIVIILTRWTDRGLEQFLLDKQEEQKDSLPKELQWDILSLPALAEDHDDQLGRAIGEALWPDFWSAEMLNQFKRDMGERDFNALYQQRPASAEGNIFKRDAWRFYDELPELDLDIQSWDTSFKDDKGSDYVVGMCMGLKGPDIYIHDFERGRMGLPATIEAVLAMSMKNPKTYKKVIENKANGPAVIAALQKMIPGVIANNPEVVGSKLARYNAAAPTQESGHIYLPRNAWWTKLVIEECAAAPYGKYDDIADCLTQGVLTLIGDRTTGILELYKRKYEQIMAEKKYGALNATKETFSSTIN